MSTVTALAGPQPASLTIRIQGRFDSGDRAAFEHAYTSAEPGTHFVVDFGETEEMTAQVDIINTNPRVRTMLELMNFDQLFDID